MKELQNKKKIYSDGYFGCRVEVGMDYIRGSFLMLHGLLGKIKVSMKTFFKIKDYLMIGLF